ncbi:MAG TPA: hypothetical protein PKK48_05015 [Phycisphaerae bacterium]|nr:hypothetical protein [Phycisphaerae bacterium]
MEMHNKVQRIRIVEIERSWTTLHKMLIGMILITFLAVICNGVWVRTICSLFLLAVLIFSFRKLHDLRHHGMTVIIERPDEEPLIQPQAESAGQKQPAVLQASAAEPEKNNWFEQPYPDPDEELFPESHKKTSTNNKGE